jgi:hypothetical protein
VTISYTEVKEMMYCTADPELMNYGAELETMCSRADQATINYTEVKEMMYCMADPELMNYGAEPETMCSRADQATIPLSTIKAMEMILLLEAVEKMSCSSLV